MHRSLGTIVPGASRRLLVASLVLVTTWLALSAAEAPGPAVWRYPERPPRIHIAAGLWWEMLRITEAGAVLGGARYDVSYDVHGDPHGYHGCGQALSDFPHSNDQLQTCNVIVLAGCRSAGLPAASQERLKQWVEHGGGLLITGGIHGLGAGGWRSGPVAGLLPAELTDWDFAPAPAGARLTPTPAGTAFFGPVVAWDQRPRLYYRNRGLKLRPNAEVLATDGTEPLLLRWTVGQGRVVLFAGTLCGDPKAGELPFWDWDGWPLLVGKALAWLAATPPAPPVTAPAGPVDPAYVAQRQQLTKLAEPELDELLTGDEGLGAAAAPKGKKSVFEQVARLAPACRDREYAQAVVRALAESEARFPLDAADAIYRQVAPWLGGAELAGPGRKLLATDDAGRAALGLRVLGAARVPADEPALLRFATGGLKALHRDDGGQGIARGLDVPNGADERLRLAAVRALADTGDLALLPQMRQLRTAWQERRGTTQPTSLELDLDEEMAATCCLFGDGKAAVGLVASMVQLQLDMEHAVNVLQQRMYVPNLKQITEKAKAQRELPQMRARVRALETCLARFPESGLPALAAVAGEWEGDFAAAYVQAALAARSDAAPPPPVREALLRVVAECRLTPVRALAVQRLLPVEPQRTADLLAKLGAAQAADAAFALSQVSLLAPAARGTIVTSGLAHADADTRRRAVRALPLVGNAAPLLARARELAATDPELAAILALAATP